MRWTRRLPAASACAATLLILGLPGDAQGQDRPRRRGSSRQRVGLIVVPQEDADASSARSLRRQLGKAFSRERGVAVVEPLKALGSRPLGIDDQTQAELQHGFVSMEGRRYAEATTHFAAALRLMLGDLDRVPKAQLAEAQVHLAAAQLGSGRAAAAHKTLLHVVTWRPRHPLRLRLSAPPGWAALTRAVLDEIERARVGAVRITSNPAGAEAFVDGRRIGPTPTRATGVTVGVHYLTLKLEGHARVVMPIKVTPRGSSVSVTLKANEQVYTLAQDLRTLLPDYGLPRVTFPALLREQLRLATALVVVVRGPQRLSAYLYNLEDGSLIRRVRSLETELPVDEQTIGTLALWRGPRSSEVNYDPAAAAESGRKKTRPPVRRGRSRPWYKRWWVWGIVGAVAVAGVVIPVSLSAGDATQSAERFRITW